MNTDKSKQKEEVKNSDVIQYATFYVGSSLLGLDISAVQEINRNLKLTKVPLGPPSVRGVMNLRGEVVTVLDLQMLLEQRPAETTQKSRNMIVKCDGELIGILVDRVADIVSISSSDIMPPPTNLSGSESRIVRGVYQMENSLVMVVIPKEIYQLSLQAATQRNAA